uniref:Putative secreted protein n=1 Tax=Anopheles darlingi TaxID=43151 RepID=A0A2M4D604_ANODA
MFVVVVVVVVVVIVVSAQMAPLVKWFALDCLTWLGLCARVSVRVCNVVSPLRCSQTRSYHLLAAEARGLLP